MGGLAAANTYLGSPLSKPELLQLAAALEGHPDNVAPAIFGGLVAVYRGEGERISTLQIPFPEGIKVVLAVPELKVSTAAARSILPKTVPLADAVFNLSHTGLLVGACFAGRADLLRVAMEDRLHQEKRATHPGLLDCGGPGLSGRSLWCSLERFRTDDYCFDARRKSIPVGAAMQEAFAGVGCKRNG